MLEIKSTVLDEGKLSFSIESRILRELGERLVKQPEVALVELVKNAYDADAKNCSISYDLEKEVVIGDDGVGMTLNKFINGWMRIGTSSKEAVFQSQKYGRNITGEKGIGRFAVRFLGRALHLETVADDPERGCRTRLIADFDWPTFDHHEDLGKVEVPYLLEVADEKIHTGTTLTITKLRSEVQRLNLKKVRSGSIGVLSPLRSLFLQNGGRDEASSVEEVKKDPGFSLNIKAESDENADDVASAILDAAYLKAQLQLVGQQLSLKVFKRGKSSPCLEIIDTYPNELNSLYADIRFGPWRSGSFANLPVEGKEAYRWFVDNTGVAVFDRSFRVLPYGTPSDDWLKLGADTAVNRRNPRSSIAEAHFPMPDHVRSSTSENWMLRIPRSGQLIGLVQVEGRRLLESVNEAGDFEGLIASADREGFIENSAFYQLEDLVRGAVEAIAFVDRKLDLEAKQAEREALVASIKSQTQSAIREIQANPNISRPDKARIVTALAKTQKLAEQQEETARERERQLEVMSLLGVVAGFMTHEFGVALKELENTHKDLVVLAENEPRFEAIEQSFASHIKSLKDFVTYSSGYIQGSKIKPAKPYPVKPRLQQVLRVFGRYAEERNIKVDVFAEADLMAPLVPASLYNGIALNLYTNALKAVTAKIGEAEGNITFRAWNENKWHYLEVSDTGIGIASALKDRVFDPLFTTTESRNDPLGSGMGLGLALVKRGVEAFGGKAELITPPPNFSTCVSIKLPITE